MHRTQTHCDDVSAPKHRRANGLALAFEKHPAPEPVLDHADVNNIPLAQDFSAMFERLPIGAYRVDSRGRPVRVNSAMVSICGFDSAEELHANVEQAGEWHVDPLRYAQLQHLLKTKGHVTGFISEVYRYKTRERIWINEAAHVVLDAQGDVLYYEGTVEDVSEAVQVKAALLRSSTLDVLTGLPNRTHFENLFGKAVGELSAGEELVLLFIDLDRFKWVNDSLGHEAGDSVLIQVARMLQAIVGVNDVVARMGGDEFCVLARVPHMAQARALGQSIIARLCEPMRQHGQLIQLGASIGLALHPQHGTSCKALLRSADLAMFTAKSVGGNAVRMFEQGMAASAEMRLLLAADLLSAIRSEQVGVMYQPQFDLRTGVLRGFEALARWTHPTLGQIPPDQFIPVAEQSGQIGALGSLVMEKALAQARTWAGAGGTKLHLAVNVSAQQLRDTNFADEVAQRLQANGLNPRQFEVEITESAIVAATQRTKDDLQRLRDIGVQIAIDDLGVGYSSLAYLKNLPVDIMKLDRSFISGLPEDRYDAALTKALTVLAHTLNLGLIAEGVETARQANFLAALGCQWGQGYYFSKPLSAEAALALVREQTPVATAA